ncbi:unnamed protein product [Hymenolepis diminuta]|uniref:Uncharacterized protein n=1 Tax=Hymenolepis diminuta TaxID=6216 RepID=A0A564Z7Z8_HYMDI|nr:unnamed protein product [Hymenolepis diminuta]
MDGSNVSFIQKQFCILNVVKLIQLFLICSVKSLLNCENISNVFLSLWSAIMTEYPMLSVSVLLPNCNFSAITKDHFKCLPF